MSSNVLNKNQQDSRVSSNVLNKNQQDSRVRGNVVNFLCSTIQRYVNSRLTVSNTSYDADLTHRNVFVIHCYVWFVWRDGIIRHVQCALDARFYLPYAICAGLIARIL